MRRIGRHPGARGILPVVVLAAVVLAGLPPAPAVARGAACSFDPGTHVDSVVESGSATIVHMSVSAGTIMVNNIACGTVNT
ncbi:MAG TPA: hypothetical protein VNN79_20365, partial [Actinomycetota bacterium]|nr:hypothetical protein [Actinomycetota bacterium]